MVTYEYRNDKEQKAMVVYIVDDDRAIRDMLRLVLEAEGYTVRPFASGRGVVEALAAEAAPCVVLLDMMMPDVSGWEVCAALAADRKQARHGVVAMTAGLMRGDACPAPARVLLPKPFDLDRVYEVVAGLAVSLHAAPVGLAV